MARHGQLDTRGRCAALLLAVALSGPAWAQQGQVLGTTTGTVTDVVTRRPVADVLVTATSPGLQSAQTALTDGDGFYRVLQLPPGSYTLRFEKKGYAPAAHDGVSVASYQAAQVDMQLAPGQVGPQGDLVARSELVDITPGQTGLPDIILGFSGSLPLAKASVVNGGLRDFAGLALVLPQASTSVVKPRPSSQRPAEAPAVRGGVQPATATPDSTGGPQPQATSADTRPTSAPDISRPPP